MPEINTKLVDEVPEPEANKTYTITAVEDFVSAVQQYKGIRVDMKDAKGNEVQTSLWLRDTVGNRSKLGAFIAALGKNTDTWKGKKVKILHWATGNREIEVVS